MWYIHIHNRILLSHKKTQNLAFSAIWTDSKGIMLSEKKAEEKILYITYMWNLKNKTSECNKKAESQIQRLVSSSEEREGGAARPIYTLFYPQGKNPGIQVESCRLWQAVSGVLGSKEVGPKVGT